VFAYRERQPWWITSKQIQADAERYQRDRYVGDPWEGVIRNFIDQRTEVAIPEILQEALHLDRGRWGQQEQNRIARCLRSFEWIRVRVTSGTKREWRYRRPGISWDTMGEEGEQLGTVLPFKVGQTTPEVPAIPVQVPLSQ